MAIKKSEVNNQEVEELLILIGDSDLICLFEERIDDIILNEYKDNQNIRISFKNTSLDDNDISEYLMDRLSEMYIQAGWGVFKDYDNCSIILS